MSQINSMRILCLIFSLILIGCGGSDSDSGIQVNTTASEAMSMSEEFSSVMNSYSKVANEIQTDGDITPLDTSLNPYFENCAVSTNETVTGSAGSVTTRVIDSGGDCPISYQLTVNGLASNNNGGLSANGSYSLTYFVDDPDLRNLAEVLSYSCTGTLQMSAANENQISGSMDMKCTIESKSMGTVSVFSQASVEISNDVMSVDITAYITHSGKTASLRVVSGSGQTMIYINGSLVDNGTLDASWVEKVMPL